MLCAVFLFQRKTSAPFLVAPSLQKARQRFRVKNICSSLARFFALRLPTTFLRDLGPEEWFALERKIMTEQSFALRRFSFSKENSCPRPCYSFPAKSPATLPGKKHSLVSRLVFCHLLAYHFFAGSEAGRVVRFRK